MNPSPALSCAQVRELLLPLVADTDTSMEVGGAAALALGLVFISSQDEDAVGAALQVGAGIPTRVVALERQCPDRWTPRTAFK